jgi:hypothetical protein
MNHMHHNDGCDRHPDHSCDSCGIDRIEHALHRLEILMASATEQLTSANNKVDSLTFQLTDFVNDVRQALTTINADQLSPTAQAQLDQLLSKTDAMATSIAQGDLTVDPTGSTPSSAPVDQPTGDVPVSGDQGEQQQQG